MVRARGMYATCIQTLLLRRAEILIHLALRAVESYRIYYYLKLRVLYASQVMYVPWLTLLARVFTHVHYITRASLSSTTIDRYTKASELHGNP